MVHYGYYIEMACLEASCWLILWPLYISQFLAYRFTPPRRRNANNYRLLQLSALALLFQSVRCVDVDSVFSVFGVNGWVVEALLGDQVTVLIVFATARVLLLSADTLYVLLARRVPRSLQWMLYATGWGFQACNIATGCALLVLVPAGPVDSYDAPHHARINWVRRVRVGALALVCAALSLASCVTLLGLRGKVARFAKILEQQEHRATRGAAALALALAAATAEATAPEAYNHLNLNLRPTAASSDAVGHPAPAPAVQITTARMVRVQPADAQQRLPATAAAAAAAAAGGPDALIVISDGSPTLNAVAVAPCNPTPMAWQELASPAAAVAVVAAVAVAGASASASASSPLSPSSSRLQMLRSASSKLSRLFVLLNVVAGVSVLSCGGLLASGTLERELTDPRDPAAPPAPTSSRQPLYALGQQLAILVIVWYGQYTNHSHSHAATTTTTGAGHACRGTRLRNMSLTPFLFWEFVCAAAWTNTIVWRKHVACCRWSLCGWTPLASSLPGTTPAATTADSEVHLPFWSTLRKGAPDVSGASHCGGAAANANRQQYLLQQQQQQQQSAQPPPLLAPLPSPPSAAPSPQLQHALPPPGPAARTSPAGAVAAATATHGALGPLQRAQTFALQDGPHGFIATATVTATTAPPAPRSHPRAAAAAGNTAATSLPGPMMLASSDWAHGDDDESGHTHTHAAAAGPFTAAAHVPLSAVSLHLSALDHRGGSGGGSQAATVTTHGPGDAHRDGRRHHQALQGQGQGQGPAGPVPGAERQQHLQQQPHLMITSGLLDSHASHAPTGLSMRSGMTSFQAQRRPGDFDFYEDNEEHERESQQDLSITTAAAATASDHEDAAIATDAALLVRSLLSPPPPAQAHPFAILQQTP